MMRFKVIILTLLVGVCSTLSLRAEEVKPQTVIFNGIEVVELEKYEFTSLTTFLFSVKLRNTTDTTYSMEGGKLGLYLAKDNVAIMTQTGEAKLAPQSEMVVETRWNVDNLDPMILMSLTMQLSQKNYKGINISYRVTLGEDDKRQEYSQKNLDIEPFMNIFAPAIIK